MRARLLLFFSACALEASSAPIGTTANPGRDVQFGPVPVLGDTASACPVPTWCAGGVAPFDSTIHCKTQELPSSSVNTCVIDSNKCYKVTAGSLTIDYLNLHSGGTLIFEDDGSSGSIEFTTKSILVEQGGHLLAGCESAPFGAGGGKLDIIFSGTADDDPIECVSQAGKAGADTGDCFPTGLSSTHYCDGSNPDDPCQATGSELGASLLFEGELGSDGTVIEDGKYPNLKGDTSQFGKNVLAVSYGGHVGFYGSKGVALSGTTDTTAARDGPVCHVPAPDSEQTTVSYSVDNDKWARESGTSWVRLNATLFPGDRQIALDRVVDWSVGDQIAISPTGWDPSHFENFTIASISGSTLTVTNPAQFRCAPPPPPP